MSTVDDADGDLHFVTFNCYRRHALLGSARRRDLLLKVLVQVRRRYQFVVVGYVVMPEHVHLQISEPERKNPSIVIQAIKLSFTRRVLGELCRRRDVRHASLFEHAAWHVWQARFYDFNGWTDRKRIEKLQHMHRNPVKRSLVAAPEMWRWSNFRSYAYSGRGAVRVSVWGELKLKMRASA